MYADPPYVEQGAALYKHAMGERDHFRLRDALRDCEACWVLSYDDHELIRDLYSTWATIEDVETTYTTATARRTGNGDEIAARPRSREIVITPQLRS